MEKGRHTRAVHRRRHHHNTQVVPGEPRLPHKGDSEIRVNAALVELVEHNRPDIREQGVLLEPGGEDAFGRHEQTGLGRVTAIESDVPADFTPD